MDDSHLLAIALVGRQTPQLITQCRAHPPSRGGFAQRRAYRFRVRHLPGANHSSAAAEASSRRTCSERGISTDVVQIMLRPAQATTHRAPVRSRAPRCARGWRRQPGSRAGAAAARGPHLRAVAGGRRGSRRRAPRRARRGTEGSSVPWSTSVGTFTSPSGRRTGSPPSMIQWFFMLDSMLTVRSTTRSTSARCPCSSNGSEPANGRRPSTM